MSSNNDILLRFSPTKKSQRIWWNWNASPHCLSWTLGDLAGSAELLSPWARAPATVHHPPAPVARLLPLLHLPHALISPSFQRKSPSASLCYLLVHSEVQHCRPELPTRLKFISLLALLKISTTAWMGEVRRDNFFPPVLSAHFHHCHVPWTCFTLSTDKAKYKIMERAHQESIWKYYNKCWKNRPSRYPPNLSWTQHQNYWNRIAIFHQGIWRFSRSIILI